MNKHKCVLYWPDPPEYLKHVAKQSGPKDPTVKESDAAAGGPPLQRGLSSVGRISSIQQFFSPDRRQRAQTETSQASSQTSVAKTIPPALPILVTPDWRIRDRMKTVGIGLILCLNVGTEPPDVVKPYPCAVLQCWMNPNVGSRAKNRDAIGDRLEQQYAKWQLARSTARPLKKRRAADPTVEDVRTLCLNLRRQAKNDRVLLHYNGHGVPVPTSHGEIWVFDKKKTEYIPLPVADLRQWMGKPTIVVLDCSCAGVLLPFLVPDDHEGSSVPDRVNHWVRETIVLAPCDAGEYLPLGPHYPADIFTSCLTTPIRMAIRWFLRRHPHLGLDADTVQIPGKTGDRKSPLGELNWIFTAVTDSIAWDVLPKYLFQRLYRQDLLVASMFRNFLLADRILRHLGCTPVSHPPLPPTVEHPLWQAWDLACETMLFQLIEDGILKRDEKMKSPDEIADIVVEYDENGRPSTPSTVSTPVEQVPDTPAYSVSSPFFSQQLAAFEVWLDYAEIYKLQLSQGQDVRPPEQLPVVLQVLLGQVHRVKALELLRSFVDLGPWAINLALILGVSPYVMKLLQSPEYKSYLVSIWASILAFDSSCRSDLLKDGAYQHFVHHLTSGLAPGEGLREAAVAARERTLAAYILANACFAYPAGQVECARLNLHGHCCALLSKYRQLRATETASKQELVESQFPAEFRTWVVLCLASMVTGSSHLQLEAYTSGVHDQLANLMTDNSPKVREAVCLAFAGLIGSEQHTFGPKSSSDEQLITNESSTPPRYRQVSPPSNKSLQGMLLAPPAAHLASGRNQPITLHGPRQSGQVIWSPQQSALSPVAVKPAHASQDQPTSFIPSVSGSSPPVEVPSVQESKQRLEADVKCIECLSLGTGDACRAVRYEAVLGLARAVEKYTSAFTRTACEEVGMDQYAPSLSDVDDQCMNVFKDAWQQLQSMNVNEMCPTTRNATHQVIRFVSERFLSCLPDEVRRHSRVRDRAQFLPGSLPDVDEEAGSLNSPSHHFSGTGLETNGEEPLANSGLPVSTLFSTKMKSFDLSYQPHPLDPKKEIDPLSPSGSRQLRLDELQASAESEGSLLARTFESLAAPQPKVIKQGFSVLQDEGDESDEGEEDLFKVKSQLRFHQTQLLRPTTTEMTALLAFHPYEDVIVSCDDKATAMVWNTNTGEQRAVWQNGNSADSSISSLEWVDCKDRSLLLLGCTDGSVRLWSGLAEREGNQASPSLVSCFEALETIPGERPGLISEWQSFSNRLVVGGSSGVLRCWDAEAEQVSIELQTNTEAVVTTITTAWDVEASKSKSSALGPHVVVAGMSNGCIKLFDLRTQQQGSVKRIGGPRVPQYTEHSNWVVGIAFTSYSQRYEVLSGTVSGEVRVWDLRMSNSVRQLDVQGRAMTTMSVHKRIPMMATGTHAQFVKILAADGDTMQVLRYHSKKFGEQRIGPVSCVTFHPSRNRLAVAATDALVGLYESKPKDSDSS